MFPQLCRQADRLLDTRLYGVGATGVTALSAGLPLLTCPGDSFAARMGASLCAATGLEALICAKPDAYVAQGIALASDAEALLHLRHQLDEQHEKLPLFDTAGWVRHLETLLEQLLSD